MKSQNWVISALVAAAIGAVMSVTLVAAFAQTGMERHHASPAMSGSAFALKTTMRELWTDHVVWTRAYIVSALAGQPDAKAAADRLLTNQEDIGKAVAAYYGNDAGNQLTALLKEHITIAVDLVAAAKAGDSAAQKRADDRWQTNAVQIAEFLSKANPNWPRATLVDMMKVHLSTTSAEVTARLKKDWAADVKAYDEAYDHILKLSDALSDGIVKQFPNKFATQPAF